MARQQGKSDFEGFGRETGSRRPARVQQGDALLWISLAGIGLAFMGGVVVVGLFAYDVASRNTSASASARLVVAPVPVDGVVDKVPGKTPPGDDAPKAKALPNWKEATDTASTKEVRVKVAYLAAGEVSGTRFSRPHISQASYAKIHLANLTQTKVIRFEGWETSAMMEDEHGNSYKPVDWPGGFAFDLMPSAPQGTNNKDIKEHRIICRRETIEPGEVIAFLLFFEKPARVSKEARLTLPVEAVGGTGALRIKVPVEFLPSAR